MLAPLICTRQTRCSLSPNTKWRDRVQNGSRKSSELSSPSAYFPLDFPRPNSLLFLISDFNGLVSAMTYRWAALGCRLWLRLNILSWPQYRYPLKHRPDFDKILWNWGGA